MITGTFGSILARLEGMRSAGPGKWQALCPAHDDHSPSLSVAVGDDGRLLLHCHAGCPAAEVRRALGITEKDLFPAKPTRGTGAGRKSVPKRSYPSADAAVEAIVRQIGGRYVAAWTYSRASGQEAYRVVRFERADGGKEYRPIHQHHDGWRIGDPPGPLPLYRLPEVVDAGLVFLVEGEKAADAAQSIGLTATTSSHGAKSAWKTDWRPLAGHEVVILPDNDDEGRQYARDVARLLAELDPPAMVKMVELPNLPKHGDIADWLDGFDCKEPQALRAEVESLAEATAYWSDSDSWPQAVTVCLADVKPEPLRWLWPRRVPMGKLTLIAGDPGLGKSILTLDMAARVSRGAPWPDDPDERNPVGAVVLLSAEDDLADTIRPRLDAAGADVGRIVAVQGVRDVEPESGNPLSRPFSLSRDLLALEGVVAAAGDVRLVVIDPISAYLGKTDSHKNAEVRGLLAPLAELAARHGVAVVAVSHLNKGFGGPAMYRTMGSLAFVAAARAVWAVSRDQDDPARRLVIPVKNNLSGEVSGMAYSIIDGQVAWEAGPVNISADEALTAELANHADRTERKDAAEWLEEALADGPMPSLELFKQAKQNGIAEKTLRRAKSDLGIKPYREGFGPGAAWYWRLPEQHRWSEQAIHVQHVGMATNAEGGRLCAAGSPGPRGITDV